MSKRSLLVMSFLFVFTFTGLIDYFPSVSAKTESTSSHTDKIKRNKKRTSGKKSSKKTKGSSKKTKGKRKSSGKKRIAGKKKSSGKKKITRKKNRNSRIKGKRHSGKKRISRNNKRKRTTSNTSSYRNYNTGTYTPPKTYDKNSDNNGSDREYKRSETSEPKESFKKEPKKDGE